MAKALIVDDCLVTRKIIARMLSRFGFTAVEAGDGQEAFDVLNANPEVIVAFVDWNMPVMTGIDFLRKAREIPHLEALKIIMVTGNNEMEHIVTAIKSGVDEYIMLPITKNILEEKLALLKIYPDNGTD